MCFSEKLTEKAAGYQSDSGYVLVGYKTVLQAGNLLMPHWSSRSAICYLCERSDLMRHHMDYRRPYQVPMEIGTDMLVQIVKILFDVKQPFYQPRTLMTVEYRDHPFHVGSSENSAVMNDSTNPFGYVAAPESVDDYVFIQNGPVKVLMRFVPQKPGALVRVLVPENAVDATNHVHAMMIIPPDEKETPEDVAACERWNAKNPPMAHFDWQHPDPGWWEYQRSLGNLPLNPKRTTKPKGTFKDFQVKVSGKSKAIRADAAKQAAQGKNVLVASTST